MTQPSFSASGSIGPPQRDLFEPKTFAGLFGAAPSVALATLEKGQMFLDRQAQLHVELRGMAIALFYAIGTAAGGVAAPWLFGALLETGAAPRGPSWAMGPSSRSIVSGEGQRRRTIRGAGGAASRALRAT